MPNLGSIPVDFTTPLGLVRSNLGDVSYKDTTLAGQGDFNYFSDDELNAFLQAGSGSVYRATATAFLQWAAVAADEAGIITDVDLKVDLTKRATLLAQRADYFLAKADAEDEAKAGDSFLIVPTGRTVPRHAELSWDYQW
jgi:predicted type IV restriction endonuclease